MKKSFCLLCLLAVLSLSALLWAHCAISATAQQVELAETAHLGDSAQAGQVELNLSCTARGQLFWDTTLIPGQAPRTDFRFTPRYRNRAKPAVGLTSSGVHFYENINSGRSSDMGIESLADHDLGFLYQPVADRTAKGTIHTEVLPMEEVFDVYPLEVDYDIPALGLNSSFLRHGDDQEQSKAEYAFLEMMEQAFRFPAPEGLMLTVSVSKGEDGLIYHADSLEGSHPAADQPFALGGAMEAFGDAGDLYVRFTSWHAATENAIYLLPELRLSNGQLLDYGLTAGGYGLYRLTFPEGTVESARLDLVLPLEPEQQVSDLFTNDLGTQVLLSAVTHGQDTLYLLDDKTGALLQTIAAGEEDLEQDIWVTCYTDDDLLLLVQDRRSARLFRQTQSGLYEEQLTLDLTALEGFPLQDMHNYAMVYDGEQLAILSGDYSHYDQPENLFSLTLWDESGLLYAGSYASSLDRSPNQEGAFDVSPLWLEPLSLRFLCVQRRYP